jgi:hypothetical protein
VWDSGWTVKDLLLVRFYMNSYAFHHKTYPISTPKTHPFEALHCFYREVGRGAQVKEQLPCWEDDPDKPGSRRAPVDKQQAAYHMQHVAACDLSECNQQAYRTLSPDPALSLRVLRAEGNSSHRQRLPDPAQDKSGAVDAVAARLGAARGWHCSAVARLDARATKSQQWRWPLEGDAKISRGVTYDIFVSAKAWYFILISSSVQFSSVLDNKIPSLVSAPSAEALAAMRAEARRLLARRAIARWQGTKDGSVLSPG